MAKKQISLFVDAEALANFEKVAEAAHMDKNSYGALWLSRLSELKLDNGLAALTAIPKDMFRQRGGRPSTESRELAALEK